MKKQFFLKSLFASVLGLSLFFFKQASAEELSLSNSRLTYLLLEDLEQTIEDIIAEQKEIVCVEIAPGEIGEAIYDALNTSYPHLISVTTDKQWLIASKYPIQETLSDTAFTLFSVHNGQEPLPYLCLAQSEGSPQIADTVDNLLEESNSSCLFCGNWDTICSLERLYREKANIIVIHLADGFCTLPASFSDEQSLPLKLQAKFEWHRQWGSDILCDADTSDSQHSKDATVEDKSSEGSTKNTDNKKSEPCHRLETNVEGDRSGAGVSATYSVKRENGTRTGLKGTAGVSIDDKGKASPKGSFGITHEW